MEDFDEVYRGILWHGSSCQSAQYLPDDLVHRARMLQTLSTPLRPTLVTLNF